MIVILPIILQAYAQIDITFIFSVGFWIESYMYAMQLYYIVINLGSEMQVGKNMAVQMEGIMILKSTSKLHS